uniref:SEFIR domain-containing protein n=1 Tax=Cyclopterus lumpus TaxID=8103 RepID=A0A8C3G7M8_CYCLU
MALALLRVPRAPLTLLRFWLFVSARALEVTDGDAPELGCSEGLTACRVSAAGRFAAALPDPDDTANVTRVQLKVILRCSASQECEPYLRILIAVQDVNITGELSQESGDHGDEDESFGMNPTSDGSEDSPGAFECCKTIQFISNYSGLDRASSQQPTHELLLTQKTTFGIPVVVLVYAHSHGAEIIQNITIPSLKEVCSMNLKGTEKICDAPRLRVETDHKRNVVLLRMENTECRVVWNRTGEVLAWPEGQREMVLPSHFIAPCLCFQVWCEGKTLRSEFCPFENHQQDALEIMQSNVTVTVEESRRREGGAGLTWNVTSPCRLEAEVRLCKKDRPGGRCVEVRGSRQRLHNQSHAGWSATRRGWQKTGEFNVLSHPLLCVQIKLHGMESFLEPQCPFATSRWRWSLPILLGLILTCLAILGAYLIQGLLKGYMWRWLKEDDVRGAVGGGHVVLLYPPGDDPALPELISHLGSSLQALGFSVSLDLWSQTELGALGPVPWLHSRLNTLQRQGGKVVLVLTQAARIKAEEWGARSWDRSSPTEEEEEEKAGRSYTASYPCGDVFTASLSCILADYLQGRAGERFMLAQLESLPPSPPGGFRPLPELFRGLHVYSLPSQSLAFLTELAGARQMATASARRKRAGGLRMASRALARRVSGFTAGTTASRLAGASQSCVGAGVEDSGETVPLRPRLITPPSSPDSNHEVSDMESV